MLCEVAAKTGARTIGYEIMADPVRFGQRIISQFAHRMRAAGAALRHVPVLHEETFFHADLKMADVVPVSPHLSTPTPLTFTTNYIVTNPPASGLYK